VAALFVSLALLVVPAKPPTVTVTVAGIHHHADSRIIAKAAFRACDSTGVKRVRIVVHDETIPDRDVAFFFTCKTGDISKPEPASPNRTTPA
jgi:hypothetical protein